MKAGESDDNQKDGEGTVYPIAMDLKAKKMVPAVLFQFDASKCRRQFAALVETFEDIEKKGVSSLGEGPCKGVRKIRG